jgi:hypothetical protein
VLGDNTNIGIGGNVKIIFINESHKMFYLVYFFLSEGQITWPPIDIIEKKVINEEIEKKKRKVFRHT